MSSTVRHLYPVLFCIYYFCRRENCLPRFSWQLNWSFPLGSFKFGTINWLIATNDVETGDIVITSFSPINIVSDIHWLLPIVTLWIHDELNKCSSRAHIFNIDFSWSLCCSSFCVSKRWLLLFFDCSDGVVFFFCSFILLATVFFLFRFCLSRISILCLLCNIP